MAQGSTEAEAPPVNPIDQMLRTLIQNQIDASQQAAGAVLAATDQLVVNQAGLDDDLRAMFNAAGGSPALQTMALLWQLVRLGRVIVERLDPAANPPAPTVKTEPAPEPGN